MRDFPFSFDSLNRFSKSLPYSNIPSASIPLYNELKTLEQNYHFPAIRDDIGSFIAFMFHWVKPKRIFEFGSGYGQSAFWYLLGSDSIEKIILTEKRDDLLKEFEALSWPSDWKMKLEYFQKDAFEVFENESNLDFILIDGVKSDYLEFLEKSVSRLNSHGLILIDNSYWRGSFLDDEIVSKKQTARKIKELHEYIESSQDFESVFLPFEDGVSLLRKTI